MNVHALRWGRRVIRDFVIFVLGTLDDIPVKVAHLNSIGHTCLCNYSANSKRSSMLAMNFGSLLTMPLSVSYAFLKYVIRRFSSHEENIVRQ